MFIHKHTVSSEEQGQTLLAFLRTHLSSYSSVKAIKRAIDGKKCKVNGRVEWFSTYPLKKGDQIEICLEGKQEECPLVVLYEDEELILYNKPSGKVSESFENGFLVHRLDKETSGVFLLAKTRNMCDLLYDVFAKRKIEKHYLALCDGEILHEKWIVDNYLGKKVSYQGGALYGRVPKEKGRRATTSFQCIKKGGGATLVLAKPTTGRTHQIRVHLKEFGHPILGDWQYSSHFKCSYQPSRMMLHALRLIFLHPLTGKKLEIEAPLPDDFLRAQKILFGG